MRKFEIFALILVVTWFATLFVSPLFTNHILIGINEVAIDDYVSITTAHKFIILALSFITVLTQLAVGIWLYIQSKKDGKSKYIWLLFGLVFGITSLILYYVLEIREKYSHEQEKQETSAVKF